LKQEDLRISFHTIIIICYKVTVLFRRQRKMLKGRRDGRVQSFSMQVVMYKFFLLNLEKNLAQIRLVVFEKNTKN